MRRWVVATSGVALVAVLAGATVGAQAFVGVRRSGSDSQRAAALRAEWDRDARLGVPASMLAPLRARLAVRGEAPWYSLSWWTRTPQQELDRLQADTAVVWTAALAASRAANARVIADASDFIVASGNLAPSGMAGTVADWTTALQSATTPAAIDALTTSDSAVLAAARDDVAQVRAAAAAALKAAGGSNGLLGQVKALDAQAAAANLDTGNMDPLARQLHDLLAAAQPATAVEAQLAGAIQAFRQTLAVNDSIETQMRPLLYEVDQAVVEATPNAASFNSTYGTLKSTFGAARNQAQLLTAQQMQTQLKQQVDAELAANVCGHNVPKGKDIVVSLSMQELVAYQDGCVVRATPVTTGRPALPTPAGSYHVFLRRTPWLMHSDWPPSSPFWYPDTWVTWVLEFREGGYFLHDADWEPSGDYGPGGEFNQAAASHGCIHIPTPVMPWLYDWTPVGTPVQVVQ